MIEICSSAGFPMALGHLNKNISCSIDYSQQPRVFIVISLLSHIYSMKPCTKARAGPIISSDNLNKKVIHTWLNLLLSLCGAGINDGLSRIRWNLPSVVSVV